MIPILITAALLIVLIVLCFLQAIDSFWPKNLPYLYPPKPNPTNGFKYAALTVLLVITLILLLSKIVS